MREMLRETTLFGKTYCWDQTNPDRVELSSVATIATESDCCSDCRSVKFLTNLSTPGGSAVQEGALTGNKPSSGASSGDWA